MKFVLLALAVLSVNVYAADEVLEIRATELTKQLKAKYNCDVAVEIDHSTVSASDNKERKNVMGPLASAQFEVAQICKKKSGKIDGLKKITLSCGKTAVTGKCTPEQNQNSVSATLSGGTLLVTGKYVNCACAEYQAGKVSAEALKSLK